MKRVVYRIVTNYQDISTCYHEAGHIICALLSFCEVSSAEIKSAEEAYTYYDCPNIDTTQSRLRLSLIKKEIGIRYAGVLSEKIFFENLHPTDKMPISIRIGSSDDFKTASDILKKYNISKPGKQRSKFKNKIKTNINSKLKNNWQDVALIANLLLDKKKITYNKIKNCLLKKSSSKKWNKIFLKIENKN